MTFPGASRASADREVRAVQELQDALGSGVDKQLPRAILDVHLSDSDGDDDRDVKEALRQLILHTSVLNPFNGANEFRFGDINDLYQRARDAGCAAHIVEVLNDPRPWFEALPTDKICLTSSRVAISIDPWQKFRGGAYGFPPLDGAFTVAAWLEDYLLYGLGDEHSWFLDQNALSFLYERVEEESVVCNSLFSLDDLRPLLRPSAESATHPLWEERHDLLRSEQCAS